MENNELIMLLRDNTTRIIASKMPALQNKNIDFERASCYEIFVSLCDGIYLLAGHPLRERFLNLLSQLSNADISLVKLRNVEYQKRLWQRIFTDSNIQLFESNVKIENTVYKGNAKKAFILNSEILTSAEDIYGLYNLIYEKIKQTKPDKICFDARKIIFVRPDDFHSQIAYDELKMGQGNNSSVMLWILCRVLMNTDIPLTLSVDSAKKAEDILSLVYRVSSPQKITLLLEDLCESEHVKIYDILLKYHKKNISLELHFSKENKNLFFKLLNIIPLAFIEGVSIECDVLENALSSVMLQEEIPLVISHLCTAK